MAGSQACEHVAANGLLLDAPDEVLDDAKMDVGLKQSQTNSLQSLGHVPFFQNTGTPQLLENAVKSFRERRKHECRS